MDDCVVLDAEFDEHASMYPEHPPLQWPAGQNGRALLRHHIN